MHAYLALLVKSTIESLPKLTWWT